MPLEVFTISGAASGYDPTTGEPLSTKLVPMNPSPTSAPPAAQLQNALRALGLTNGDPALASLTVDGIIGPKTVAAVNHALSTYIGATKAFPAANLDAVRVRQYAAALAGMVVDRVKKSGGTVGPVVVQHPVKRVSRGGGAAPIPVSTAMTADVNDNQKWIWYVVGGVGVLAVLTAAASAAKRRKAASDGK